MGHFQRFPEDLSTESIRVTVVSIGISSAVGVGRRVGVSCVEGSVVGVSRRDSVGPVDGIGVGERGTVVVEPLSLGFCFRFSFGLTFSQSVNGGKSIGTSGSVGSADSGRVSVGSSSVGGGECVS